MLPVPATCITGRDGTIRFAYFNPDYRQRVRVRQLALARLFGLASRRWWR